jgi:FAD:protein FMN transferase
MKRIRRITLAKTPGTQSYHLLLSTVFKMVLLASWRLGAKSSGGSGLILAIILLFLTGCGQQKQVTTTRFLAFGTLIDLSISGVSEQQAAAATAAIEKDFAQMHKAWHAWDPGPLGRVNRLISEGASFTVPPSVLEMIRSSSKLAQSSDHLFNPAIGQLIDAWGFHSDDPAGHKPPPPETIARLLAQNPRMTDLALDGIKLHSNNPNVKLDFGAFGKGFGIDLAINHLREMGIENAILNAGGDLRAIGSPVNRPWRIAIRHPSGEGALASVEVAGDESVFTSGDYERNFTWKGETYHHIIDPRTGYPARGTGSVTVIHRDAATADAAATALFVAGPGEWHRIARQMELKYVLLVDKDGAIHMNPAMQQRVNLDRKQHRIHLSPVLTE